LLQQWGYKATPFIKLVFSELHFLDFQQLNQYNIDVWKPKEVTALELAYKFRLYPNEIQKQQIECTFGCCRFVYNHCLDERINAYKNSSKPVSCYEQIKEIVQLKKQNPWLCEADSTALQAAVENLDAAYKNFFRRIQAHAKKAGFPVFRSKKNSKQSYKSKCVGTNIKIIDDTHIQLPKLGRVKCVVTKHPEGRILSATVSRAASGKYFVSVCCTDVEISALPTTGENVGIDLGIKDLAVTNTGDKYPNAKNYIRNQKKLARLQRQLSRKPKGSKNRRKMCHKIAMLHERITNQRNNAIHNMTTDLVRKYDIICLEDLNVKDMMHRNLYAKFIADASWHEIRRQLEYKAKWYGKKVVIIDRFYPSSQLCSNCGYQNKKVRDLKIRKWVCLSCGSVHDRDINAAINIFTEGTRISVSV